jgi:Flp pilus assembly pilin Flp
MFKEKMILLIKSSKAAFSIEYALGLAFLGTTILLGMGDSGTAVKGYMTCISDNSMDTKDPKKCFN